MESQEKDEKSEAVEKRDEVDNKTSNLCKGSNASPESVYPSSSSYTTAEEVFHEDSHRVSNGTTVSNSSMVNRVSVDQLYSRIRHLEDLLAGKEAALMTVTQELDAVREMSCIDASMGPLPSSFDADFKASVDEYNTKLQEHASALCQRDEMIEKLADSLKQSVKDREELKTEAKRLTQQVHILQSQLHSVGQHVQQPQTKLLEALKEKDAMLLKKSAELSQCKAQSSKEVQFLMSSLEELQQRAARSSSSSPPASKCHDGSSCKFATELNDLRPCFDALNVQVKQLMSSKDQLEIELASIKQKHCEEIKHHLSAQENLIQELVWVKQNSCVKLQELTSSHELLEKELLLVKEEHCTEVKDLMSSKSHQDKELASLEEKHLNEVKNILSSQVDLSEELALLKQKHSDKVNKLIQSKDLVKDELESLKKKHCDEVKVLISAKDCLEKELVSVKQKHCEEVKELMLSKGNLEKELQAVKQKHCEEVKELMLSKGNLEKELQAVKQKHFDDSQSLNEQVAMLQNKLKELSESVEGAAVEVLINKCRNDVKFLQSLFKSVNPALQGEVNTDNELLDRCEAQAHHAKDNANQNYSSGLTLLMSRLVSHCEDLENRNLQLKSDIAEAHAKISEAERKPLLLTTKNISQITGESCACHNRYQEERNLLKKAIEVLQEEKLEKDLICEEKVKNLLKKSRSSNQSNVESEDNFINLINEYSHKSKEIIVLQSKLEKAQLECQMSSCEKERQINHLKEVLNVLEESLQKCCFLEETLQKTFQENSILQTRLNRLESLHEYRKHNSEAPVDLMWQLIDELVTLKAGQLQGDPSKEQVNTSSAAKKIESGLKIINKMNVDCESLLVKSASDDGNVALRSYLQSEALGLRRLQTALRETEQTIISNSGPALQLHVDLLQQQLESKKLLYQNICEAHYSLEAEMREMEEKFKQQEEALYKELSQQKLVSKLWQLKAQGLQMQVESLKVTEGSCEERLLESFVKIDGAYSQVFSALRYEVERVASQRESKVRLEMTEKIFASERNHKQQLEELSRHVQVGGSMEALQILHQQEIDAVRAECDYSCSKAIHTLQERLLSHINHPPKVGPNDSFAEISLLLMKHSVSSQYNVALKKVSSNLRNELLQKLDCLEVLLRNICSSHDQEPDFSLPDEKVEVIKSSEELIQKAEEFGKRLVKLQREGLKTLLAVCEENHKLMLDEIRRVTAEFVNLSDVKHLQEKLLRSKEEQRLALESLSASHKAEVSRLRLLLSQQNASGNSRPNETALTLLRKELEEKHKRQMEELRTYFEQKCADFEKHYSEEVFSQHSRKLSDSSSTSESELVSEMYYAGPGSSNCTGSEAPSYFSDLLGESNYKELEEHAPTLDLDKLFADNREQIETMRLALESRHQGELEAQKELYEVRLEELLRNMNESHAAELKFQSKRLKELQEIENMLNKKLFHAKEEIAHLKVQLNKPNSHDGGEEVEDLSKTHQGTQSGFADCTDSTRPFQEKTRSELEDELLRMSDLLKRRDSESSAQIASLKVKLRENHETMSKLEKDLTNLRSKYSSDIQTLTASIDDKVREIDVLNLKVQELSSSVQESSALQIQLEANLTHQSKKLEEEYESRLQKKEEECECQLNELRSELAAKYAEDLLAKTDGEKKIFEEKLGNAVEQKKQQLDSEYAEYLDFVKKCADDTKIQLMQQHEKEMAQTIERYDLQIAVLKNASKVNCNEVSHKIEGQSMTLHRSLENALKNERCVQESSLSNCLQDLLLLSSQLNEHQQEQLEKIIFKVCQEETRCKEKLHQDLEMRLDFVQKECERRFHLQLEEARSDIVQALERQIQQLLDDNTDVTERPAELQQLEQKFARKYLEKLSNMQKDYETKITDLCMKHAAQISHARSKNKVTNDVIITSEELDKVCKERDCLRNVAATLRDVVAELVRYFMSWEDDFNNTLMDELAKFEAAREDEILSVTQNESSTCLEQSVCIEEKNNSDDEMPVVVATPARSRHLSTSVKRVHFGPDISGILSLIDDGSLLESVGFNYSMRDASLNFQEELDRCLARLRSDSAALYALSKPALPSSREDCSRNTNDDKQSENVIPEMLTDTLQSLESLQKENQDLRSQLETLHEEYKQSVAELEVAQQRLNSLEQQARHQAEVVAEGYGEGERSITCDTANSPCATSVEELQNKARNLLLGIRSSEEVSGIVSPTSGVHLPHMVEELCRDWERLAEESRHKQEDLQQQVDVADKQLKAARVFMDEQATERELERDEFVQEIKQLQELLRDKDRDRSSQQHMNHEVETLESQLKETQSTLVETQEKLEKLSAEHKQAVEKIWTLRDIISDLELQIATKAEEAASAFAQNKVLHEMVEQQGQTQLQLAQEMEELQMYADNRKLVAKISQLEEQLRSHQVLAEQLGDPSVVDQMKTQLHDLSSALELHTRELECANASTALPSSPCLSSPSEDVSIRETLEAIRAASEKTETSQLPVLPLNEVSQVMEQWQKHARADDAILKKIRDLDMQLDDIQAEKHILVANLQEQMLLTSSLQAKLDEHRRKADVKLSEATAEMQGQIEDLRSEIHDYVETLEAREKQVQNLRSALQQAENNRRGREAEIRRSTEAERTIASRLQLQVSKLAADKAKLQGILSEKDAMHVSLPALVESMLLDKNADIDRLEKQVHHLSKQMELSSYYVATPSTSLEFEYRESEQVRAHVALSPVLELKRSLIIPEIDESSYEKTSVHQNDVSLPMKPVSLEKLDLELGMETEDSLKPVLLEETVPQQNLSNNSNSASDTLSSLADTFDTSSLSSCEKKVAALEEELKKKNQTIEDYMQQLNDKASYIVELELKIKLLAECEERLAHMSKLEDELKAVTEELKMVTESKHSDKAEFEIICQTKSKEVKHLQEQIDKLLCEVPPRTSVFAETPDQVTTSSQEVQCSNELEEKESEIQRLKNEVCATQTILANLQKKVQEAKQIARSPSRSSPDNQKVLRAVQSELEAAKQEIIELKDLCKSIKSEVESESQQKQAQFEELLNQEQHTKQSLIEALEKMQTESTVPESQKLEEELKEAKDKEIQRDIEIQKLQVELKQLNMECITLRQQLHTPISQNTALTSRLDAEKKFADALKDELYLHKSRASILDQECKSLRDQITDLKKVCNSPKNSLIHEENQKLLREVAELKSTIYSLKSSEGSFQQRIEKLQHDNTILQEENTEVGKELSDMKQLIIQLHVAKASLDETQELLQSKIKELNDTKSLKDRYSEELRTLRQALKNLNGNINDYPELVDEDRKSLSKIRRQLCSPSLRGAGDGPWNKLVITETDVHEISPDNGHLQESESLDNITDLVQHEVDVSVQLDHSLLQTINPSSSKKVGIISGDIQMQDTQKKTKQDLDGSIQYTTPTSSQKIRIEDNIDQVRLHQLEMELNQMKAQYYELQQQDCHLIQEMRIKLSEALDGQVALKLQMENERTKKLSTFDERNMESILSQKSLFLSSDATIEKLQVQLNEATSQLMKLQAEKDSTEKQLRRLQEVEVKRSHRRADAEQKYRRHIEQLQTLHRQTQQECSMLHQELSAVNVKLQLAQEEFVKDRNDHLKNHTPFVERLKKMNTFLEEHIEENQRMAKQMEDLTEEHRRLRCRIAQLEAQLAERRNNESFESVNARFAAERAEWEAEHKLLLLALNEAKQKRLLCGDADVEERVSHLFGRYLRMQSYRKALVWQKRYLLSVISGINESKSLAASHLSVLAGNSKENQQKSSYKFRSVVLVMIAIHRMKFMVERWLRGKRIGCGVVVQQTLSHTQFAFSSSMSGQGQQHLFQSSHQSQLSEELRSGLSQSPPTLERPRQPRSHPTTNSVFTRSSLNSRGLGTTSSLSEQVSNFNLAQQHFDTLLSNPPK